MRILTKKSFLFNGKNGETFTTMGGGTIETAPDWIENDKMFGWAMADGDLVKVADNVAVSAASDEEKPEDAEPEPEEKPEDAEPEPEVQKKAPAKKKTAAKK